MGDVESPMPSAPTRTKLPVAARRWRLFAGFGIVSFIWLATQLYMHERSIRAVELGGRLELNMDYTGGDIGSVHAVRSADACRAECERNPLCLTFTYVVSEKVCWLKGEKGKRKSNTNTISGSLNASLSASHRSARHNATGDVGAGWMDESADGPLADVEPGWPEDEGEGADGWDNDDGVDDFDGQANDDGMAYDSNRTRYSDWGEEEGESVGAGEDGSMLPVPLSDDERATFNESTNFIGDVLVVTEVRDATACHDRCLLDGQCIAWTLDRQRYLCALRLAGASAVRFHADAVGGMLSDAEIASRAARLNDAALGTVAVYSGPAMALPTDMTDPATTFDDTDLVGGAIGEVGSIDTVARCRAACRAKAGCAAWTLSKRDGSCQMKNGTHVRKPVGKAALLTSGLVGPTT